MWRSRSLIDKTTNQPKAPTAVRVVGCVRVSTEGQALEGVSLEAQRVRLFSYAQALGFELCDIISNEDVSGGTLRRPGLERALRLLEDGRADAILVTKLDRLTRSVRDLAMLVERYFLDGKWSLLSVGDAIDTRSSSGRLVLNMLISVAQWERETISERTREALEQVRREGRKFGRPPLGWRRTEERGIWERDPAQEGAKRRILELYGQGLTTTQVAGQVRGERARAEARHGRAEDRGAEERCRRPAEQGALEMALKLL